MHAEWRPNGSYNEVCRLQVQTQQSRSNKVPQCNTTNTFLVVTPYNGHMWPTRGPHELHGTGSTIMPLEINLRATCGPQVSLPLSIIHA